MRLFLLILLCVLAEWSAPAIADEHDALAIIVGLDHASKTMTKPELALIFWRKKLFWPNGARIHPVNLSPDHMARTQFSNRVLGSLPESQADYWNGLYFHGISPPHVVRSGEAAMRFVAETRGAIAYVPACTVDERVKILGWLDENGHLNHNPPACAQ